MTEACKINVYDQQIQGEQNHTISLYSGGIYN